MKNGGGDHSPPPCGTGRLPGRLRPDLICAHIVQSPRVALLRTLVAPLVMEGEEDRLRVPEVESLVPIFGLLRQAPARP